ncbi:MAG: NAD(P)-dependent oxidoreductase [Spirosomataceae bacterium]
MFPKYTVIEEFKEKFSFQFNPEEYYIISVQHLLRSTGSMFEALIDYGFNSQNIYLTGKIYSTHIETQNKLKELGINIIESEYPKELGFYTQCIENDVCKMWQLLSENLKPNSKIIILDDGGYTLKNVPENILNNHFICGIEQTTSGIRMQNTFGKFPVIHVAASAAKVIIEPPIVSEAVKIQLGAIIIELNPQKIGIVGFGHIGKAVVNEFKSVYDILVFDIKNELKDEVIQDVTYCNSLSDLYNQCDVVIGATGQDISDLNWLTNSTGDKTLISVSSGDIEFNSLLRACKPYLTEKLKSPLQILTLKTQQGHSLKILRGGMVANFTGKPDSSPGHIIQVTRGLLFSAIIQILRDSERLKIQSGAIILDPYFQKEVVQLWFQDQPQRKINYDLDIINNFNNIKWIKSKS